jgi:hypothetical protein
LAKFGITPIGGRSSSSAPSAFFFGAGCVKSAWKATATVGRERHPSLKRSSERSGIEAS